MTRGTSDSHQPSLRLTDRWMTPARAWGNGLQAQRSLGVRVDHPLREIDLAAPVVPIHGEQLVNCGRALVILQPPVVLEGGLEVVAGSVSSRTCTGSALESLRT